MAKKRIQYVCQACGHMSPQWLGRCPHCLEWNTLEEEAVLEPAKGAQLLSTKSTIQPFSIAKVKAGETTRIDTGIGELNRVLGGGLVPGELLLLAGDPGIGKSTLTLQLLSSIKCDAQVLYVSGEESKGQIRHRAERLNTLNSRILLLTENDLSLIEPVIKEKKPGLIVVDSIQTVYDPEVSATPGSVSQLRQIASRTMEWAKGLGIPTVLVGHVTKEGSVAGPRVLEHMVDAVLYFEGDRHSHYRVLRTFKNRFGSTNEIGLFDMKDKGLVEVTNPSETFLAERPEATPGSTVTATMEGTRPILVEIQALVAPAVFGQPRRMSSGAEYNRVLMLLAVLEKRMGLPLGNQDVYLNVVGGLRIDEPAADLAMAMAIFSAYHERPLPDDLLLLGEIGLTGELRRVSQVERRLREASGLGFGKAVMPAGAHVQVDSLEIMTARHLADVVRLIWGE